MAHARSHRRSGGGVFATVLLGSVLVIALLIGWLVWGGGTTNLGERASNIDIRMPRPPVLPATPNPEPMPLPTPARPG
jgi:hypothetical protein